MPPQKPERAPKAKRRNNRASHKSNKNGRRPGSPGPFTSDAGADLRKVRRRSEILLNYARFYDGQEVELPEDEDFAGFSALPRKGNYLRIRQLREQVNSEDKVAMPESFAAPAPWVPDPYDDSIADLPDRSEEEGAEGERRARKRTCRRPRRSPKERDYYSKFFPLSRGFVLPEDESEEEELPEHIIRKTPPTFMGIPREVRMKIYHFLLTVKKPIAVHGGWRQVYRNNDLNLPTSILRVCQVVYREACAVLYGANTFLYRLRDPTYNVRSIANLATDDMSAGDWLSDGESESGSEYEEEESLVCPKETSININKYAPLFRKISVEAEHNRYSRDTQESMAAAISVFARQGEGTPGEGSCNIHTLTIRVTPLREAVVGGPDGEERFTFVDFFLKGAPVICAIKAVDCQVLHVDILTRYMSRPSSNTPLTLSGNGACRLTVNRRHERLHNMALQEGARRDPVGGKDEAMQRRRADMAKKSAVVIDELAAHIKAQCSQRVQGTTMDLAVDLPHEFAWDEIGDEDML
ncbi:hypothetical protein Trco_001129 [Trichoderma cornu-damae]|uniref:Uncharacterized protein n=1 Tax=Trichoderma cornu-damae TaxID=654480 RepID=A0A9P8U0Z4_9HYPO|nr:hypothetical protein Trco_001129 [Trichoderma cornu-damae]